MKINEFPERVSPKDEDLLLIYNPINGVTRSIKLSTLKAYFGTNNSTPTPTPTPSRINLAYSSNGDTNGLFYYVGTNKFQESWQNPHTAARVTVAMSSVFDSNHNRPGELIDRVPTVSIATSSIQNSFFSFDLGSNKDLILSAYSVRGRDYFSHHPRNWKFQGSNDGVNWTDIDTQLNNTTINQNVWLTVAVSGQSTAYRYFRFLQTGLNSNSQHILCLGEIELYGSLRWSV